MREGWLGLAVLGTALVLGPQSADASRTAPSAGSSPWLVTDVSAFAVPAAGLFDDATDQVDELRTQGVTGGAGFGASGFVGLGRSGRFAAGGIMASVSPLTLSDVSPGATVEDELLVHELQTTLVHVGPGVTLQAPGARGLRGRGSMGWSMGESERRTVGSGATATGRFTGPYVQVGMGYAVKTSQRVRVHATADLVGQYLVADDDDPLEPLFPQEEDHREALVMGRLGVGVDFSTRLKKR